MTLIHVVYIVILSVLSFFIVIPYFLVLLSLFKSNKIGTLQHSKENSIACVITAFKNIEITKNLVASVLKQQYTNYHVYLVADNCEWAEFPIKDDKLTVLFPSPYLNSKSKSIKYAIDKYVNKHDFTLVLDPDNLIESNFLKIVNQWINKGYQVVQGKRIAKNLDSIYARLDAMSDYYYNYSQRMMPHNFGLSATIAGSGMAIKTSFYQSFFEKEDINKHIIAEDKMLQVYLVGELNQKIAFANEAILLDEKVSTGDQVQRQRTRWIASFFQYFKHGLSLLFKGLFSFNLNKAFFGYTIIIPPLFIMLGVVGLLSLISLPLWNYFTLCLWLIGITLFCNFMLCLVASKAPYSIFKAILAAPLFIFRQLLGFTQMSKTKTDFLVTEKKHSTSIEDFKN